MIRIYECNCGGRRPKSEASRQHTEGHQETQKRNMGPIRPMGLNEKSLKMGQITIGFTVSPSPGQFTEHVQVLDSLLNMCLPKSESPTHHPEASQQNQEKESLAFM